MTRRMIHAWFSVHPAECRWPNGRCNCGAESVEAEVDFETPDPADDMEGFVESARRAVAKAAVRVAEA